jgi:4-hydroxy-3-polyprenylbenzoate decarboxylase
MNAHTDRLVVAITGASGAILGIRLLELLQPMTVETHLVISEAGRKTIQHETDWQVEAVQALADRAYGPDQLDAPIASGSFSTVGMLVVPCSVKTLSGIANTYTQDLVTRAADVTLKEGRPLILAVRETPLHHGHLRNMLAAAQNGAVIFPPLPAFYNRPGSIDEMIDSLVGRMLARAGIQNRHYPEWGNDGP